MEGPNLQLPSHFVFIQPQMFHHLNPPAAWVHGALYIHHPSEFSEFGLSDGFCFVHLE